MKHGNYGSVSLATLMDSDSHTELEGVGKTVDPGPVGIQLFLEFYTPQYSILVLVLGTSASSLAWPIHFFPHHGV